MIPIVIISYNNYKYVDNTIKQIVKLNEDYFASIIIMDNCSTCEETVDYLKNSPCKIIYNTNNNGPWVNSSRNSHIYNEMPDTFILTDADLQLNPKLPRNFVKILSNLSSKYECSKIGFALDISDYDKMFQGLYFHSLTIYQWEKRFWEKKINDDTYELYAADIDTTFCIINKKYEENTLSLRIAGDFLAKHLPWYVENTILTDRELYRLYKRDSKYSTISRIVIPFLENKYGKSLL